MAHTSRQLQHTTTKSTNLLEQRDEGNAERKGRVLHQ